jgi:hypothetical protein
VAAYRHGLVLIIAFFAAAGVTAGALLTVSPRPVAGLSAPADGAPADGAPADGQPAADGQLAADGAGTIGH